LLLLGGEDSVSEDAGRMDEADVLLDGLVDGLRAAGRVVLDPVEPDRDLAEVVRLVLLVRVDGFLADDAVGLAADRADDRADVLLDLVVPPDRLAVPGRLAVPDRLAVPERVVLRAREVVPEREVPLDRVVLAVAAFTVDMVFAAAVSAFAAVDIDLVAVLIARMAFDMVLAEAVALVAAAFILVAADVTLVAADDTVLAAVAGEAPLRVAVVRDAVLRDAVPRAVVRLDRDAAAGRDAVERDADGRELVLRERDVLARDDVVPRDDRDALLRLAAVPEVLRAGRAEVLRDALVLVPDLAAGRLAALPDALRLTDLLRVVPAVRRVAARVVV
jgi:hypothetical protein